MKKTFILSFLVSLAIYSIAGTIEKTYYFASPQIVQHGEYQLVKFDNTMNSGLLGQPTFPYQSVSLLVPPGEIASSVEIICEGEKILDGVFNLYPYQPSRPLSDESKPAFQKNNAVYQSTEAIPLSMTGNLSTSFMNGFGFAFSTFTPVRFIPSEGKLSYYSKITVRLTTMPDKSAEAALKNLQSSVWTMEKVKSLAQNQSDIEAYSQKTNRTSTAYDMLIITTEAYMNSFTGLIDMYLHRGIKTQLVTKETINFEGTGADTQEKIRNYIIQEYQTNGVEFVLLGGDVELIPYRGFYDYVVSGSGYEDYGIPADLYYSALDGNWNTDNDNKWGEADEDDLLPEIAVARFPFSNVAELASMIHKSDFYQNQPVLGELTSPLLAGEYLYSGPDTWGSDYLELLVGERSDNGYTTFGIPESDNIQTMYEEETPWSGQDLINAINQGKQFVHHVGHASQTYVAYLSNSDITNANFSGANGVDHNYTFLQTHGCDCGAFDYGDCILEKMVTIDNFAAAVIGNSRYGWFNEGQTEGPAAHLHREMVDAMYHHQINFLGKAMVESKIQTAPWVEAAGQWEEGALRWNFYDLNILGDPALSVWTAEPISLEVGYLPEIAIGTPSTNVHVSSNGEPMANFNCSILLNNNIIAQGFTDVNGDVVLQFDPLVLEVCTASLQVVGYNSLPVYHDISFIPDDGPYLVYESHINNDSDGNNDGFVDYGETIGLCMLITNVGTASASNITATLSSTDTEVVITDGTEYLPELGPGVTVSLTNAFWADFSASIADQHIVNFTLTCTDGTDTWISNFSVTVHAPQLSIGQFVIDDSGSGNGNGMLDPGETVILNIPCSNSGSSAGFDAAALLTETDPNISITSGQFPLETLVAGETKTASYEILVAADATVGTPAAMELQLSCTGYQVQESIYTTIGLMIEDFETGDFSAFEWHHEGDANWMITDINPFEGVYSAKSGSISDTQQSKLWVSLIAVGDDVIAFQRKVSSESNYDFLRFYMDDVKLGEWSGEADWEQVSYPVTEGQHNLLWAYEKDYSMANGSDCAWIDEIYFPTTTMVIGVKESLTATNPSIYPNPNQGQFTVNLGNQAKINDITIYNSVGLPVYSIKTADQILKLELTSLPSGMYLLRNNADGNISYNKFVVR
ncbi:MAG: T9SS type A sorting domain-containing protein [Bacteroidales bacterium]|nr:T9SS type A sorting domain-containing protein [Bacteroidales bacterium]